MNRSPFFAAFVAFLAASTATVVALADGAAAAANPSAGSAPHLGFPLVTVGIFVAAFAFSLFIDLVQHRSHGEVTAANAAGWSVFWVALSLGFYGWIRYEHGPDYASMFLTGYVLEKTLSVDNLMVFIAVFEFFKIKSGLQHRILYWGILGAIVFRAIFVAIGSTLLLQIGPIAEVVFGAIVAWAAVKMLQGGGDDDGGEEEEPNYEEMGLVRFFRRFYPVYPRLRDADFFVSRAEVEADVAKDPALKEQVGASLASGAKRWMTPAFVALLVIEGSDVLFAFDSVPAVIAVTKEPLLVFTAMIFAVLGLRSLYFLLLILTKYLVHLEKAVIFILFFIAFKMFLAPARHYFPQYVTFDISPNLSLLIVMGILGLGVIASLIWPEKPEEGGGDDKKNGEAPQA
jgi:tellurite resistance protein TerC